MNNFNGIYPKDPQTMNAFRQMLLAPNDEKPIVEMNDETSRDINVIWSSIESLAASWRGGKDCCFPSMPTNRKKFWGAFASDHESGLLPVIKEFIESSTSKDMVVIDLGCGNSPAAKLMLGKGWRVIAVDSSRIALNLLISQNEDKFQSGELSVIEEDISTYVPSEPVDLVIAADSLQYIDPAIFHSIWSKIHDTFIKENGFFIGSLFRAPPTEQVQPINLLQVQTMNLLKEMGAWFLHDRRMVRPLLTQTGYEIKTCKYRIDESNLVPMCIQFIAEKKTKY